ncbi:MAG: 30S ribosomal protein S16 [Candidatus Aminicenantia bacterium]
MLRIRLMRFGTKKKPFYRIVAIDSKAPRESKPLTFLGYYDPRKEPSLVKIDKERIIDLIKKGAQPSQPVLRMLKREKII